MEQLQERMHLVLAIFITDDSAEQVCCWLGHTEVFERTQMLKCESK